MFGPFMNVFFCTVAEGRLCRSLITDLLDERVLVGGAFAEKIVSTTGK
jgi:hypothetical protein